MSEDRLTERELDALEHGLRIYGRMLDLDGAHIEDAVRAGMRAAVAYAVEDGKIRGAVDCALRHWLVLGKGDEDETFPVWSEEDAAAYGFARERYRVDGPFVLERESRES